MKKLLLISVLLFCFLFEGNTQRFDYENTSKMFFGLNIGRTWHTSDVENVTNRFPLGAGFVFGGSMNQNYGNILSFDLRLRYLGGNWYGQDSDTTSAIQNNYAVNSLYDTLGYTVQNFKAAQHRLSLELSIHANRVKERTGIDPYLFAGIGITGTRTRGDLLKGANGTSNGGIYPYNQTPSGSIIDQKYNTFLDKNEAGDPYDDESFEVNVLPSLGVGIGYYFNNRFSIGVEHKTTFFLDDYFDGTTVNQVGKQSEMFKNDLYHFTSIYFKWYLRSNKHTWESPKEESTTPVRPLSTSTPVRKDKPIVDFTSPSTDNYHSNQPKFTLKAKVQNVESANDITFSENYNETRNFSYNANSSVFQSQVLLVPGKNVFYIQGVNQHGKDNDQVEIYYKREERGNPPIVKITNPSSSPHTISQLTYTVRADIRNIRARNKITVIFNGQKVMNFNFNKSENNNFSIPLNLKSGINTLRIEGENDFGIDSDETVIIYKRSEPTGYPPIVNILTPNVNPYTTAQLNENIVAKVDNITSKNQVEVRVNGVQTNNFTFTGSTNRIELNAGLNSGTNIIRVSASNTYGNDFDESTIIYKRKPVPYPLHVSFITPLDDQQVVTTSQYKMTAKVENITHTNNIKVYFNGNLIAPSLYVFNQQAGTVQYSSQLKVGKNTYKVTASNNDGSHQATTSIERKKTIINPGDLREDKKGVTNKPNDKPCEDPLIQLVLPKEPITFVSDQVLTVRAIIKNIKNINGIELTLNGQKMNDFLYHSRTQVMTNQITLKDGRNTYTINLTNDCSTIEKSFVINYTPPPCIAIFNVGVSSDFCLVTPSGEFNGHDLKNNLNFKYSGSAEIIYFKAIGNGTATVDGKSYTIVNGNYYQFMGNLTVDIARNSNGQWSACVTSVRQPMFGKGKNKPVSLCSALAPQKKPTTPRDKVNVRNKPDLKEKPNTRGEPDKRENSPSARTKSTKNTEDPEKRKSPTESEEKRNVTPRNSRGGG